MKQEEYEAAALYWEQKEAAGVKMEQEELVEEIQKFILSHNTCALATGSDTFIRCTPIEYSWNDGAFWMFSEGGLKFRALKTNLQVSLAIFDDFEGFGKLKGLQVSGKALLIDPDTEEYEQAARFRKIPVEALRRMVHQMYLIKVVPQHFDYLSSDMKERGYDVRQPMDF